ncbi:heat-inducible transcription repressor HrcA [Thermosyntropha lipolytica DSM 11003]|uniref:Heat-inducible transcription repressor HrcA n=1 Tax=Thermosyntropha lipolytica DSM 11003 TaxID=1123382 RepID=A0A1M5N714_9FIRM|nr:heat-inducible transcriptional repressor HrcA [Thermosyntropha lipolytica]SHG85328.1 heat-inducible transcription repressor HrcA [Thermosyntropha lipolytica DSM 11003]
MSLDERKKIILESIIKDYVETAEPVGSRAVVKKHGLNISAATVRNEMADLEEMGYLEQPYTSAGRIPSQLGYRYYVDCMMQKETLSEEEIELLQKIIRDNIHEWNEIIEKVSSFLAQATSYASFVIFPSLTLSKFKYLQILPIEDHKALVIAVTDSGLIMHRKIEVPPNIAEGDLETIAKAFNKALGGKRLNEITRTDLMLIRDSLKRRKKIIDRVLEAVEYMLAGSKEERIAISGTLNILNEPEFKDLEKLKKILAILEEDVLLRNLIPEDIKKEVEIRIGTENNIEGIKEISIVVSGYHTLGQKGKIGVIGPIRMEYWKAAGTVETVGKVLEQILKGQF